MLTTSYSRGTIVAHIVRPRSDNNNTHNFVVVVCLVVFVTRFFCRFFADLPCLPGQSKTAARSQRYFWTIKSRRASHQTGMRAFRTTAFDLYAYIGRIRMLQ